MLNFEFVLDMHTTLMDHFNVNVCLQGKLWLVDTSKINVMYSWHLFPCKNCNIPLSAVKWFCITIRKSCFESSHVGYSFFCFSVLCVFHVFYMLQASKLSTRPIFQAPPTHPKAEKILHLSLFLPFIILPWT